MPPFSTGTHFPSAPWISTTSMDASRYFSGLLPLKGVFPTAVSGQFAEFVPVPAVLSPGVRPSSIACQNSSFTLS